MNEAAFDDVLDALVRGEQPDTSDNLTCFAADLYRKEHGMMMPVATKHRVAATVGLAELAPVSNRIRRARALPPPRRQPRWLTGITVALAALLALTGVFQWSMRTDNGDNRFGLLSPAVPTAEATPAATLPGDIGWLNPIMWDECPDDVGGTSMIPQAVEHPYLGLLDRAYGPYTSPAAYTRGEVLRHARELRACGQLGRFDPSMSSRMVYEMNDRDFVTSDEAERFWASQIVQGKELSAFYASDLKVSPATLSLVIPAGTAGVAGIAPGRYVVINPDWIVQLADGRVVVLVSMLTVTPVGTPVAERSEPTAGFRAWVFVRQDGEWMLDEFLPVCFGECEEFWVSLPGANLLATPAPTPTVSNGAEIVPVGGDSQVRATPTLRPSPTGTAPSQIQPIDVTPTPSG